MSDSFELEVEQITHGPKHHFFGYIGQSQTIPWNQSGRYIVALRNGFQGPYARAWRGSRCNFDRY